MGRPRSRLASLDPHGGAGLAGDRAEEMGGAISLREGGGREGLATMAMRDLIQAIVLAVLGCLWCGSAALRADEIEQAVVRIRGADGAFRAITQRDVARAKAELALQAGTLAGVLDRSPAHGPAWKSYLLWDSLAAQLAAPSQSDLEELSRIVDRFTRDHDALGLPAILRTRAALIRYYHRCLGYQDPQLEAQYRQRLSELAGLVESLREDDRASPLEEIALQLQWLARHEQIPEVVSAVRRLACEANLHVFVSDDFITSSTWEEVDRVDPLTDCVLGTAIRGTSHLTGTMAAFPVGSEEGIRLQARLRGDAASVGRGYNGPVRANVVGNATVQVSGELFFGPQGFRMGDTLARVSATGRPTSIWTTCRSPVVNGVVTRAARRRAAKTQELGDWIASRHAEEKLEVQVADELRGRLEELQQSYLARFRQPLLRREMFPRTFRASSGETGARLEMLLATPHQLGAPQPPPFSAVQGALRVALHESAVNNLAASMLAGRTMSEVEVRDFLNGLFGAPSGSAPVREEDVVYITFADERPLILRVDDSLVTLQMRASNYIVNRRKIAPMNVTLRYRLQRSARGVVATQAAEPEIVPPRFETAGRGRLGTRETTARRLILNMLQRELSETYQLGPFLLPDPADAFGKLVVTELVADDHWLAVGLERAAADETTP